MPEGPEIKRAADALKEQIEGRVIDHIFFGLESLKVWEELLTGERIRRVDSRGKVILIRLSSGRNIYSHNQLYGRWHFCGSDHYQDSNRQLRMAIGCQGRSALLYSASDIAVLDQQELLHHPYLQKLGPDVLHESTTIDQVVQRLRSDKYRNRQLGGVLTDQSFVAGLGNYLRCEILFVSRLHPRVRAGDLKPGEIRELAGAILKLLNHIPDKYEHLVRYYGYYSNRSRGARRQAESQSEEPVPITIDDRPPNRRCKANWARLIQKVYEVDPLECPRCGEAMRIIALIDEPAVIERILRHLKVWDPGPAPIQPAGRDPPWPQGENLPLTYHSVPDIA